MNMDLFKFKVFCEGAVCDVDEVIFDPNRIACYLPCGDWITNPIKGSKLMQFIGHKDAEGNEIYTGMILEDCLTDRFIICQSETGEFYLEDAETRETSCLAKHDFFTMKITGTIFESIE